MDFIDTQTGWLLARACSPCDGTGRGLTTTLRFTRDGGQTWSALPAPPAELTGPAYFPADPSQPNGVSSIRFATRKDGWAFGPGLYSTHDGGLTWANEHRLISGLAVTHGALWAVEQNGSTPFILRSTDNGRTWHQTPTQPSMRGWPSVVSDNAQTAWLYAQDTTDYTQHPQLLVTHNGGRTWQALPTPTDRICLVGILSVVAGQHLWFVCADGPATIMQAKQVFVSADGGNTWKLAADDTHFATPVGQITIVGHIIQANCVAAISATTAFMALNRGTLIRTTDGGHTWNDAIPYAEANNADGSVGPVYFVGQKSGWVAAWLNRLFRTLDGGMTWTLTLVP
jgi:photosystem II stability/assembly factor-like uncharacterized protein